MNNETFKPKKRDQRSISKNNHTVKTAVLLCELNRHITHFLHVHELLMVHTSKRVFFTAYTTTHIMYVQSMRESRINTVQAEVHARRITRFPKKHTKSPS